MNKFKFLLMLTVFLGCLTTGKLEAQHAANWEGFNELTQRTDLFESKVKELLTTSTFLNVERAAQQLESTEGAKVKIPWIKPRNKKLQVSDLVKLIEPSFVSFATAYDCGSCHNIHLNIASGYIISTDGLIVTNHHVVQSFTKGEQAKNLAMVVSTHSGEVFAVKEIVSSFKDGDLVIVKVDTKGGKLRPLPFGKTAQVGDDVFVLSNPAPMTNYFSTGKVAKNYLAPYSSTRKLPQTAVTADYAAGSSGAPIVDRFGNLVSTVCSTSSIYYNMDQGRDLQMVVKNTIPVILLKELISR